MSLWVFSESKQTQHSKQWATVPIDVLPTVVVSACGDNEHAQHSSCLLQLPPAPLLSSPPSLSNGCPLRTHRRFHGTFMAFIPNPAGKGKGGLSTLPFLFFPAFSCWKGSRPWTDPVLEGKMSCLQILLCLSASLEILGSPQTGSGLSSTSLASHRAWVA